MAEKKKRLTAHETAIKLLTKDAPESIPSYLAVFVEVYGLGTVVPARAIPDLIKALQKAFDSAPEKTKEWLKEMFKVAIQQLREQLTEAKKTEEKETAEQQESVAIKIHVLGSNPEKQEQIRQFKQWIELYGGMLEGTGVTFNISWPAEKKH